MQKKHSKKQINSFQRKVYEVVKKIPGGKTMSYKEVASKAGYSFSWRAVGNALNKNKNPKIPCHRVIKVNGFIGGYNRGTLKKIALLRKEGVMIKNGKII